MAASEAEWDRIAELRDLAYVSGSSKLDRAIDRWEDLAEAGRPTHRAMKACEREASKAATTENENDHPA